MDKSENGNYVPNFGNYFWIICCLTLPIRSVKCLTENGKIKKICKQSPASGHKSRTIICFIYFKIWLLFEDPRKIFCDLSLGKKWNLQRLGGLHPWIPYLATFGHGVLIEFSWQNLYVKQILSANWILDNYIEISLVIMLHLTSSFNKRKWKTWI